MCNELFSQAAAKLDCPIRLYPMCHKNAHLDVFVNAKQRTIILCCSACDRPVATIKAKNGQRKRGLGIDENPKS